MSADSDSIAADLRGQIQGGCLKAGAQVPTVDVLAEQHAVSRNTAHRALSQLRDEGLILTRKGRPGVVADQRPTQVLRWDRYRRSRREDPSGSTTFERQVAVSGWRGRVVYPYVGWVPCPADVAESLQLEPGASVVERRRLRMAAPVKVPTDGALAAHEAMEARAGTSLPLEPVIDRVLECVVELFTSWVPMWVANAVSAGAVPDGPTILTQGPAGVGGTWSRIERDGRIPIDWIDEWLSFPAATDDEVEALGLRRPERLVKVERVVWSQGRPVTFDRVVTLPSHVQFVYGYSHGD